MSHLQEQDEEGESDGEEEKENDKSGGCEQQLSVKNINHNHHKTFASTQEMEAVLVDMYQDALNLDD